MKPNHNRFLRLHALAFYVSYAVSASAADYSFTGTPAAMVAGAYVAGDNVTFNITGGYFGTSAAKSQTFNNANIVVTSLLQNNGWSDAFTTFASSTTLTGSGPFGQTAVAGSGQDWVFAGNLTGYSGNVSIILPNAALSSGTVLGTTTFSILQYGGTTAGGTVAKGPVSGGVLNNVAGTGTISANNLVLNYGTDASYDSLKLTNSTVATRYGLHNLGNANIEISGAISGAGPLNKQGTGKLTLSNAGNSYTGATNISAGTLALTGAGTVGTGILTVSSGTTFDVSGATGGTYKVAGTLRGAGTVIGNMVMENPIAPPVLTVTAGASLTFGNDLTFTEAGDINVTGPLDSYTSSAAVKVGGNLTVSGGAESIYINLPTANVSAGTYRLVEGSLTSVDQFFLNTKPVLGPRQTAGLALDSGDLVYTVSGVNPTWSGAVSTEWSTNVLGDPKNWSLSGSGTSDYIEGDVVTFDDTAAGTSVAISVADVSPLNAVFNNTTKNYTVTGPFGIAGAASLAKTGTGTLALSGPNTYSGTTTISGGRLQVGDAGTSGSLGTGNVINDSVLAFARTDSSIVANAISGTGSVLVESGIVAFSTSKSYTGGTTINAGVLDITGGGGGSGTIRGTATVNAGATLRLSTGDATGFATDASRLSVINLVGGTLDINTTANQTLGSAVINMTGASITGIAGSNLDFFAGASALNSLASATESNISLPNFNLRQDNTAFTVANGEALRDLVISSNIGNGTGGNHNLNKAGAGTMVLTGVRSYTGATTVSGGTLTIQGTGTGAGTSGVTVNGAGSLLVATGGNLTSSGALSTAVATGASIVVETGATLTAASSLIAWNPSTFRVDGIMNITGALTVSSNATAPITGSGTINAGSFTMGNALTTANFSAATMNLTGSIVLGSATASHSTRLNQNAGTINAGGLQLGAAASTVAQTYALSAGTLNLGSAGITTAGTGTRTVLLGAGTVGATAPWSTTLAMGLTSAAGTTFDTTGGNISLSGALSGAGGKLVKSGTGTLILTGANTYGGDTVVNAGTLAINGVSIANSGKLAIIGGNVDVAGTEVVDTLFLGGVQKAAGTWGSSLSTAANKDDTYFAGTGVVSVTTGPVAGFATWAAANAGGGTVSGDFDNDGVSNGTEYFLGATGSSFTANSAVVAGKVAWTNGGNIASAAYGTEFVVQTSPDLNVWTNVAAADPNLANTTGSLEYTLPTGAGKVFVRLVIMPN